MRFMMLMIPKGYEDAVPGTMPPADAVAASAILPQCRRTSSVVAHSAHFQQIEWASRCPASGNEVIEVRQVQEFGDFPPDVQQAAEGFHEMQQTVKPKT